MALRRDASVRVAQRARVRWGGFHCCTHVRVLVAAFMVLQRLLHAAAWFTAPHHTEQHHTHITYAPHGCCRCWWRFRVRIIARARAGRSLLRWRAVGRVHVLRTPRTPLPRCLNIAVHHCCRRRFVTHHRIHERQQLHFTLPATALPAPLLCCSVVTGLVPWRTLTCTVLACTSINITFVLPRDAWCARTARADVLSAVLAGGTFAR